MAKNEKKIQNDKKEKNGNGNEKQWRVEARKLAKLPEEEIESRLRTMALSKPDKVRFLWNAIEEIQADKKLKSKKQEEIPVPVVTPQKEKSQETEKASEKKPYVKEDKPVIEDDEQTKKEDKTRKIGKVIEMSEIGELREKGANLFTVEDLRGNEPWRMALSKMMGNKSKSKIGDKISIRQKIMDGEVPKRYLAIVPGSLIGRKVFMPAKGKVPEYEWATLIPGNIPSECDPRIQKALGKKLESSDLRVNANIRDGLKANTDGSYDCEIELGYNITEKIPNDRTSKGMYTAVPYLNIFPREGKIEGPEYTVNVLIGPLDNVKSENSIVIGPSKGLVLLRGDNVEAVTLYLILEPIQ